MSNSNQRAPFADNVTAAGNALHPNTRIIDVQSVYQLMLGTEHTAPIRKIVPPDLLNTHATNPIFDHVFLEWQRDLIQEIDPDDPHGNHWEQVATKMRLDNGAMQGFDLTNIHSIDQDEFFGMSDFVEQLSEYIRKGGRDPQPWLDNNHIYMGSAYLETNGMIWVVADAMILTWSKETGVFDKFWSFQMPVFEGLPNTLDGLELQPIVSVALTSFALIHTKYDVEFVSGYPRNYTRKFIRQRDKSPSPKFILLDPLRSKKVYDKTNGAGGKNSPHIVRGHWRVNRDHPLPHLAHKTFWIQTFTRGGDHDGGKKPNYKIILPKDQMT